MTNEYVDSMEVFNKVLKPPFADPKEQRLSSGDTIEECQEYISARLHAYRIFVLHTNTDKSISTPTQDIIFLGYHVNTLNMTIALTSEKKQKIWGKIEELLAKSSTIREVSSLLGSIVLLKQFLVC